MLGMARMDEVVLRIAMVGVAGALGIGGGWWWRRRTRQPPIRVEGLGLPAGAILFTSMDCASCKRVVDLLKSTGAPLREVTYELEAGLMTRAGVMGVPLLVIVSGSGENVAQLEGVPSRLALRRALGRAGF